MFSQIWQKIKELIGKVTGTSKNIEQALHIKPSVSNEMIDAIELWGDMYKNKAPWLKEPTYKDPSRVVSLGIPAFIASEKARMCTLEMKSEITAITKETEITDKVTGLVINQSQQQGSAARAEYLNKQYQNTVIRDIRRQLEYALAKGGMVIKPYVILNKDGESRIVMDYIQADGFYPISFDAGGRITEAAFVQKLVRKDHTYSRLEYHKLDGKTVAVINKAYRSNNNAALSDNHAGELGTEIPLSEVSDWAGLEPETTIKNVDRLLFVYLKTPIANTIDTYSPLGMSVYGRASNLIRDADEQYSRLLWEFEGSELAVDVDRDALAVERDARGNDITIRPNLQRRLFRRLDEKWHKVKLFSLREGLSQM